MKNLVIQRKGRTEIEGVLEEGILRSERVEGGGGNL
jgi:hypothetical protein